MNDFILGRSAEIVFVFEYVERNSGGVINNFIFPNPIKCRHIFQSLYLEFDVQIIEFIVLAGQSKI